MKEDLKKQIDILKQRLKVAEAIDKVKLFWPGDHLNAEEQMAIRAISDKFIGEGESLGILFACTEYRSYPNPKPKKILGRGRPKNSKDYAVKKLINNLAIIYERNKGSLPNQYQSQFGNMIEEIAYALNVKDAKGYSVTWNGHVNDVLKGKSYSRLRKKSTFQYAYKHFEDALKAAENDTQWKSICEKSAKFSKVYKEAVSQALIDYCYKMEFEAKIKEMPGSDSFKISVQRKYDENSTS